ncbi:mau2 chromatid cohesion factor [Basidiobolus ranarum]|uniref:Mau2 chromatid cohesion factor n=1 Tax=Basidiobolus ranarum TaxID=34480 RepID=A0ABR2W9C6_9FUNG
MYQYPGQGLPQQPTTPVQNRTGGYQQQEPQSGRGYYQDSIQSPGNIFNTPFRSSQTQLEPQTPSQGVSQHKILWTLTEHYLAHACQIASGLVAQPTQQKWIEHQRDIKSAVYCLEAVLKSGKSANFFSGGMSANSPSSMRFGTPQRSSILQSPRTPTTPSRVTVMPKIETKTRFRLAQVLFQYTENIVEAEEHLQKAILLAQKLEGYSELKFQMIDLQCQILERTRNFKIAQNVLKNSIVEAGELNLPVWIYHFLLLRAKLYYMDHDFGRCLSSLSEALQFAERRQELDMKACILLTKCQYALSFQQYHIVSEGLSQVSILFPQPRESNMIGQGRPIVQNRNLQLCHYMILIIYSTHTGNIKTAMQYTTEMYSLLETPSMTELQDIQGFIKIPIRSSTVVNNYTQGHYETFSVMTAGWLTKNQLYSLAYLISGMCNKSDNTNLKAKTFLTEGLKNVELQFSTFLGNPGLHEAIEHKNWCAVVKAHMLLHLSDVLMLRSEFQEATKTLLELVSWSYTCGFWEKFAALICSSWGMLCQFQGQSMEALQFYEAAAGCTDNRELVALVRLNQALIHIGLSASNREMVHTMLDGIRPDCLEGKLDGLKAVFHVVEGLVTHEIVKAKQNLLETLKLTSTLYNTQLKSITLSLLGTLFQHTQNDQSEKMLTTAYLLSRNSRNDMGCLVAGGLLRDLYHRQGLEQKTNKQNILNQAHWQQVERQINPS